MSTFTAVWLAATVLGWAGEPKAEAPEAWKKTYEAATQASKDGRRDEAEAMLRGVVAEAEKAGPDDLQVAEPLEKLAGLIVWPSGTVQYDRDAPNPRYEEAEAMLLRALAIRETRQGRDHPDVAGSLIDLASLKFVLSHQPGRRKEATELVERALTILHAEGADEKELARALHLRGLIEFPQGHFDRAQPYFLEALAIRERQFGPESPKVAAILDDLGDTEAAMAWKASSPLARIVIAPWKETRTQQHGKKAYAYYIRALAIREKALAPDHHEIADTVFNIGQVQYVLGEYDDAEQYLTRWLAMKNTPRSRRPLVLQILSHSARKRHDLAASRDWREEAELLEDELRSKAAADRSVQRAGTTAPTGPNSADSPSPDR